MSLFQGRSRLRDIVRVSQVSHASANIERDKQGRTVRRRGRRAGYAIRCIADGMNGSKRGMAISIIGPYGSGKSTLGPLHKQNGRDRHPSAWKLLMQSDCQVRRDVPNVPP